MLHAANRPAAEARVGAPHAGPEPKIVVEHAWEGERAVARRGRERHFDGDVEPVAEAAVQLGLEAAALRHGAPARGARGTLRRARALALPSHATHGRRGWRPCAFQRAAEAMSNAAMKNFCFDQLALPDQTVASRVSMTWRAFVDDSDDEDDDEGIPISKPGRTFSVFAKLSVGPALDNRRRVRAGLWAAPSSEDLRDTTHVGVCIDDRNEVELERGVPSVLHFREYRVPAPNARTVVPPMTIFVEWSESSNMVHWMPMFELPVCTLRMIGLTTHCLLAENAAEALARTPGCLPEAPAARPVAASPFEACAKAAARREARKKREREE